MRSKGWMLVAGLGLCTPVPAVMGAQAAQQPFQSEVRVDGILARTAAVEAAYGLTVPAGIYMRAGLVAGIGAARHGVSGRTDLVARFSLDPFRQSRWAPYAGAGLSGRYRTKLDGGCRAYLLVFLGVEGPLPLGERSGWVPALEIGLGGGGRVGVIMRKGINARR